MERPYTLPEIRLASGQYRVRPAPPSPPDPATPIATAAPAAAEPVCLKAYGDPEE